MRAKIFILPILLLLGGIAFAAPQKINVGFYASSGYYEISENGEKNGYGYELFRRMSRYANLNFDFTYGRKSRDEMLKRLESGAVDIVLPVNKSKELESLFAFSLPIGPSSDCIAVRKSDSTLLNEINYAIQQMNLIEPNWKSQMNSKYFGDETLDLSVLSERERAFLQEFRGNDRMLKVTVRNAVFPYAFIDDGMPKGILLDIFAEIALHNGLKYEFVMTYDTKKPLVVLDGRYGITGDDDAWVFTPEYLHDQVLAGYDSLLQGMSIAVPRSAPRELASILTKGVLSLSPKVVRAKVVKYAGFRMPNYSGELLHAHSRIVAVFGLVFGILGLALIASLVWLGFRRKLKYRQNELDYKLREANAFAAEAKEAKSKFLLNMSHDIRTPMNAIIGYADRAERHITNTEDVQDALKKIRISGGYLLQLIEEVLNMAKIESGQLMLKERMMNLPSCMTELCESFVPMMSQKNLSFIWDFSEVKNKFVMANVNCLRQILYNIISNAEKFTTYGGRVVFTVEELPCQVDGYTVFDFEISDNGLGMSKAFLEHIFEEFAREQNSTQSRLQGTGLGMSIVKRLADMIGAEIDIQSEIGLGTTVHVRIQFKIATESDVALDHGEMNTLDEGKFLKGKHVLLVEDNEFNREVAQDFLLDAEMSVDIAENGLEAVTRVREHSPDFYDCILMDVQMPVMDGYEATKAIRKIYPQAKIPIIALSANAFDEDRQKSLDAGMDDHLPKPFVVAKVLETMNRVMQRKVNVTR
ncbi:response regulator [Fibrobacter sp. UWB11]|uniref:response regulator n=1 Tax=Fibrobacter sp. UWB11 TaxID=1896202 RepID=UPI0009298C5F|nr:response regulator [Fibrobacter sp. UWB11]SIO29029.1 Signal transduction histidine kinase [Fibrobacter sp. UWB11]